MDKAEIKRVIAQRAAKELTAGDVVNLGIGIPTQIPAYLPEGVDVVLQSENGIVGTGPKPGEHDVDSHVTDAGGAPASVRTGGSYCGTAESFGLIRGGHVNCTFLGALQVDAEGSLANWIIPGKMVPGMGGAMDLVVGAKRVIVTMEHTQKGTPKILQRCTLPLTAAKCVEKIITEMGVMVVRKDGLHLTEINPEFTPEEVQAATGATLIVETPLKPML